MGNSWSLNCFMICLRLKCLSGMPGQTARGSSLFTPESISPFFSVSESPLTWRTRLHHPDRPWTWHHLEQCFFWDNSAAFFTMLTFFSFLTISFKTTSAFIILPPPFPLAIFTTVFDTLTSIIMFGIVHCSPSQIPILLPKQECGWSVVAGKLYQVTHLLVVETVYLLARGPDYLGIGLFTRALLPVNRYRHNSPWLLWLKSGLLINGT